ncbi:MAG: hypothetical protein RJB38_2452 [Pseudomonadota bacterium]
MPNKDQSLGILFAINGVFWIVVAFDTTQAFTILLATRALLTAVSYLRRVPAIAISNSMPSWIVAISVALPFAYSSDAAQPALLTSNTFTLGNLTVIFGTFLSTWGIATLGNRFGITPANRGAVVRTGPYRYLDHPIYTGYVLCEGALVASWPTIQNITLFVIAVSLYVVRARCETKILTQIDPHLASRTSSTLFHRESALFSAEP